MIKMRVVLSADMTDMMIIFNKMMLENTSSMGNQKRLQRIQKHKVFTSCNENNTTGYLYIAYS